MPELRYGCYDYLLKPVMEDDIIKVMKILSLRSKESVIRRSCRKKELYGTS